VSETPNKQDGSAISVWETADTPQDSAIEGIETPNKQDGSAISVWETADTPQDSAIESTETPHKQDDSAIGVPEAPHTRDGSAINVPEAPHTREDSAIGPREQPNSAALSVGQGATCVQPIGTSSNGPQRGREAEDAENSKLSAPLLLCPTAAKTNVRSAALNWEVRSLLTRRKTPQRGFGPRLQPERRGWRMRTHGNRREPCRLKAGLRTPEDCSSPKRQAPWDSNTRFVPLKCQQTQLRTENSEP
jgi:hypothetical protein